MILYHVFKSDCYLSSRIMLQKNWVLNSHFMHLPSSSDGLLGLKSFDYKLSFLSLARLIFSGNKINIVLVFHAQATLPYLLFAYALSFFMKKNTLSFVYDIHDLHEKQDYQGVFDRIRYGAIRYYFLLIIERWTLRNVKVKSLTVSEGLAILIGNNYGCKSPEIVCSAPLPAISPGEMFLKKNNAEVRVIYFGILEHAPIELVRHIASSGSLLDMYGRDITVESLGSLLGSPVPNNIKICGPYFPESMGFLENYDFLLLYKPENISLNYRHALPNKLFQSLIYGVRVIHSPNFYEVERMLSTIDGAAVSLYDIKDYDFLVSGYSKKDILFFEKVHALASSISIKSKLCYLSLVKH